MAEQGLGVGDGGGFIELNVKTACMILCYLFCGLHMFTRDAYSALQPLIKTTTTFLDLMNFSVKHRNVSL